MNMRKIVFVSYLPLSQKAYEDYFMAELKEAGFEVEYLDLSSLFHQLDVENYPVDFVRTIDRYRELRVYLKKQDHSRTLFVVMPTYDYRTIRLYRMLKTTGCITANIANWSSPYIPAKNLPLWRKVLNVTPRKAFSLGRAYFTVWLKRIRYVKLHDIVFRGGYKGPTNIGYGYWYDMNVAKVIDVNSHDYTKYQHIKERNERVVEGPYIVFLDEYLPLHPDFEFLHIPTIGAERYYEHINLFFDRIEQRTGLKVVIAAHPKALRYKNEDFFNGRDVFFHQTAELVAGAEFVMMHGSTSGGHAVMFAKPMILLYSEELRTIMPRYVEFMDTIADEMGLAKVNYDRELPAHIELSVDSQKYDHYKYDYLTSSCSENHRTMDIFMDYLKQM